MSRIYSTWGEEGDAWRKLKHDTRGEIGNRYFSDTEISLFRAIQELSADLRNMTPAQRVLALAVIGVLVASLVSGCASPGGVGPMTSVDQGDHYPATATTIGGVPDVKPIFVNTLSPDQVIRVTPQPATQVRPPEVKPSPVVTKTPEVRIDAGGVMTPEEMAMFQRIDKSFLAQCEYWGNAPIPAVNLQTCRNGSLVAHIMIDKEGGDMGVAYQVPGENELYALPWGPNGPIQIPATGYVDGLPKKGAGPLRLTAEGFTADGVHYRLGWKNHRWVRVDDTGKIIEKINDQGVWEIVREVVEISTDPTIPSRVEWAKLFGSDTAFVNGEWTGFETLQPWGKIPRWENTVTKRLGVNAMSKSELKKHIKKLGFVVATAPDGIDYFMIVEAVQGNDGRVSYWKLPLNLNTYPAILSKSLDMDKVHLPMVSMGLGSDCPSWTTGLPCGFDAELLQAMEDFLETGIASKKMEQVPLMDSGAY